MYIQRFQIYKEISNVLVTKFNPNVEDDTIHSTVLVKVSDVEYITQQLAFKWIDEEGNKEEKYVILPVIRFDENATI